MFDRRLILRLYWRERLAAYTVDEGMKCGEPDEGGRERERERMYAWPEERDDKEV